MESGRSPLAAHKMFGRPKRQLAAALLTTAIEKRRRSLHAAREDGHGKGSPKQHGLEAVGVATDGRGLNGGV